MVASILTFDEIIEDVAPVMLNESEKFRVNRKNMDTYFYEIQDFNYMIDSRCGLHSYDSLNPHIKFSCADIVDQLLSSNPGLGESVLDYDWENYKNSEGKYDYTYGERFKYANQRSEEHTSELQSH